MARCNSRVSAIIFLPRVNPTANHFGDLLAVAAILSAAGIVSVLRTEAALESLQGGGILIYLPARFSASISLNSCRCIALLGRALLGSVLSYRKKEKFMRID